MTGFDPGRVRLRLHTQAGRVDSADVRCERPVVTRLLCDKPAEQAAALVPLIYSLCGKAQGIAARAALSAARGNPVAAHVDADALAEAVREHAWKLFVDWPRQLGLAADEVFFVRLMRADAEARPALASELAAHPLLAALRRTLHGEDGIDRLLLERLDARMGSVRRWLTGRPQELGTVAAATVAAGTGEARVETARGPLLHRLVLEGDRVADYVIAAPTDVQFAADGPAAHWLAQLAGRSPEEARRLATRVVMAFDPCVPWELS